MPYFSSCRRMKDMLQILQIPFKKSEFHHSKKSVYTLPSLFDKSENFMLKSIEKSKMKERSNKLKNKDFFFSQGEILM